MSELQNAIARPTARAVLALIGRDDLLHNITWTIQAAGTAPQVILLTGDGGIGKTRLLYAIADNLKLQDHYLVATQEIDCYDEDTHSKQQFAAQLAGVLPAKIALPTYQAAVNELQRAEQRNDRDVSEYRRKVEAALRRDLTAASQQKRTLLLLDTVERLIYVQSDRLETAQIANSWNWIADQLLTIPNITWVIAGRPSAELLFEQTKIKKFPVPDLDQAGARAYIEALISRAQDERNSPVASRLQTLLDPQLFSKIYDQTSGRPLTLSLLADLMTVANLPSHKIEATQRVIIDQLMEVEDLSSLIRVFGRLRRGVDVDMLKSILNEVEGWSSERVARLFDEFKQLSFVKKPRGERYFLHDIMYELLDQHLYNKAREMREAGKVYQAAISVCKQREEQVPNKFDAVFAEIEHGYHRLDLVALNAARNERRQTLLDRLYYELCNKPLRGWHFYLRYTFDAVLGGDWTFDILLLAQTLNTLIELEARKQLSQSGLSFGMIQGVALIRPIVRAFAENDFARAVAEAQRISQNSVMHHPDEARTSPMLDVWHAAALIPLAGANNLEQAEQLVRGAIEQLQLLANETPSTNNERAEQIRAQVGLAFAYLTLGDYYRQCEQQDDAEHAYREAVKRGREAKVLVVLTIALSRLGLVFNRLGLLEDAIALIEDALKIRQRIGLRNLIAAAHSSLGIVLISQGNYQAAVNHLRHALTIYEALGDNLGITQNRSNLAEANRRYAGTIGLRETSEAVRLLSEARAYADDAVASSDPETGVISSPRSTVRALIEQGCALRELARETYQQNLKHYQLQRLISEADVALRKAAAIAADKDLPALQLDALANIPFLYYYVGDYGEAQRTLAEIWSKVPREYLIESAMSTPPIADEDAQISLWRHIAKLSTLRGHLAFQRYELRQQSTQRNQSQQLPVEDDEDLQACAEAYVLAVEYNEGYSHDETGIQRSRQQIYDRLGTLDVEVLRRFARHVQEIEKRYGFETSNLQRRLDRRTLWFA